jgi:hypothetical protein
MTTATTAEEIRVDQFVIRFLVEAEATAGTAALFEFDVRPGLRCRRRTVTTASRRRSRPSSGAPGRMSNGAF